MDDEAIWCFFVSPKVMKIISLPIRIQVMWGRSVQCMSKDTACTMCAAGLAFLCVRTHTHTNRRQTRRAVIVARPRMKSSW